MSGVIEKVVMWIDRKEINRNGKMVICFKRLGREHGVSEWSHQKQSREVNYFERSSVTG